ncbi:MAG TPA: M23 family metallopeptidase [Solirubrobacteraceae bacterium]|jgi:murein DD-endopeptidase MepM/ murein hydrolase activator NlpD
MASIAVVVLGAVPARAIDSTGGTLAPLASVSTVGTGGAEYTSAPVKPRVVKKPVVKKPVVRKPKPRKPAPKKTPAPTATPAPPSAGGAVFPVVGPHSFGGPENRFGAGRVGHIHEGQDVLASEGQQVVAPLAGTIITTGFQAAAAGWYVAEHTTGTFDFFFAHCQTGSLAVTTGQPVHAGEPLCRVGQTGDATGPHLHFEMWVGGWQASGGHPIDPLPYLEAWEG